MRYTDKNADEAYESERALLLTQHRQAPEKGPLEILDTKAARRFITCLDILRSLKDDEVSQMIEEFVDKLYSNPAIPCKGILKMVNSAGNKWPKAYRFDG